MIYKFKFNNTLAKQRADIEAVAKLRVKFYSSGSGQDHLEKLFLKGLGEAKVFQFLNESITKGLIMDL